MARVYLDESVLYLRRGNGHAVLDPGARLAIEMLAGDGHDVVVVDDGSSSGRVDGLLATLPHATEASPGQSRERQAWHIVGERARCGSHVGGLRTILVGGGSPGHLVGGRCDLEVADLFTAALSVIAASSSRVASSIEGGKIAQAGTGD